MLTYQVTFWNSVYDDLKLGVNLTEDEDLSRYARMEKLHDARQPFIEEELIGAIKNYN